MFFIKYYPKRLNIIYLFLFLFCTISLDCKKDDPASYLGSITLTLEDISCTEAWFKINTGTSNLPLSMIILINDSIRSSQFVLTSQDTIIQMGFLKPNRNYTFQLINTEVPGRQPKSLLQYHGYRFAELYLGKNKFW